MRVVLRRSNVCVVYIFRINHMVVCSTTGIAIAACIPVCLVPVAIYVLLDKEPLKDHLSRVQYTILVEECSEEYKTTPPSKPIHELVLLFKMFPLIGYAYVGNFCTHLTMTAVLSTLTFPSSPFRPRDDHFQYYRLLSDAGMLFGGMGSLLVSCLCQKWMEFFRIRNIWIPALLNASHLLLFVFASWYRFLPSVIVVLMLCFTQGVLQGSMFVQCMVRAADVFSCARDKGTALGLVELGNFVGRIGAAILGVSTEICLREHCTNKLMLGQFCLARLI
jgi:hypothetical protein